MASLKDIRKKISSTKNTQQITKAMKMVSAAKLRRSQRAIVASRPYAYKIRSLISHLAHSKQLAHPLLTDTKTHKKLLMVVVTSDRGLCGPFNANIVKATEKFWRENKSAYEKIDFIFVGRKGAEYFKKRDATTVEAITNLANDIKFQLASDLSVRLMNHYLDGGYDEIRLVYNEFKSAISQKVVAETLLPVQDIAAEEASKDLDYIFEPEASLILDQLLNRHFAIQVYRVMLESLASEHGARMNAMENATRNAGSMIRKLTLTYNKTRQAAITRELIEIVSGAEAL